MQKLSLDEDPEEKIVIYDKTKKKDNLKFIIFVLIISVLLIAIIFSFFNYLRFTEYKELCNSNNGSLYYFECPRKQACLEVAEGWRCDFHNGTSYSMKVWCKKS